MQLSLYLNGLGYIFRQPVKMNETKNLAKYDLYTVEYKVAFIQTILTYFTSYVQRRKNTADSKTNTERIFL